MTILRQQFEWSCICVLGVSILPLLTILLFDFWIVPTVWYYCFYLYFLINSDDCFFDFMKWAWSKGYYWQSKLCFLSWPWPWNRQWRKIKNKLYDKHDDITFPIVNFPFNSSSLLPLVKITIDSRVFQHHHHMEFTFHNSCDILGLVPSTLIFRTDISCWRKSYSNKNSTVVITITVTKYLYLKWRLIIYYLRR